jgi:hypothetical protein
LVVTERSDVTTNGSISLRRGTPMLEFVYRGQQWEIQEGSTKGSSQTANPGKMGQFLTAQKNSEISDDQKEALCNPLKSNELAQKKPAEETTGKVRLVGFEPTTYGLGSDIICFS